MATESDPARDQPVEEHVADHPGGPDVPVDGSGENPGVTVFTVVFSLGLVLLIAWWIPYIFFAKRVTGPPPQIFGVRYLPMLPVFIVLVLIIANLALRPLGRLIGVRLGFGRRPLMVIFAVTLLGIAGIDAINFLIGLLPCPYYYATPENDLEKYVLRYHDRCEHLFPLRPQYRPGDKDHIELLYRGLPAAETSGAGVPWYNKSIPVPEKIGRSDEVISAELLDEGLADAGWLRRRLPLGQPGRRTIWQVWAAPLAWWIGLFTMGYFVQFCMMSILRRQWFDNERLMFPHMEPIRAVAEYDEKDGGAAVPKLLTNGVFWAGAAVPAVLLFFDGLNHYFPAVPAFGLNRLTLSSFLTDLPWKAVRPELKIEPYLVAIGFLLTAEISFSLWFFAVVDNLVRMGSVAAGLPPEVEQALNSWTECGGSDAVGAVFVFVAVMLWAGRRHFVEVFRKFIDPSLLNEDDAREPVPYRFAVVGFVAGTLLMLAWCRYAGMSWWVSGLLFGIWYVALIFIARVLAETGLVTVSNGAFHPPKTLVSVIGFHEGRMASTFTMNVFIWPTLHGGYGSALLGWLMNGYKAVEGVRRARVLSVVIFAGIVMSVCIASFKTLEYVYGVGALNSEAGSFREVGWIFNNTYVRDILLKDKSHSPDWGAAIPLMMVGAAVMSFLLAMRHLFYWWPLHPIGYVAIGIGRGVWFSFFLGWFIKRTVLKYGGGRLLGKVTPAVYGLFIGQFFVAGIWFLIDLVLKVFGVVA